MIGTVRGTLTAIEQHTASLQLGPIGLELSIPAYLARRLEDDIGREITLWTSLHLDSTSTTSFTPRLLGFASAHDRRFFEVFTTVKGLGSKRAMRALIEPPGVVAAWIASGNAKKLVSLPEVGKRLADTIIAELSGKIDAFIDAGIEDPDRPSRREAKPQARPQVELDAIAALIALGQIASEAEAMVDRALDRAEGAILTTDDLVAAAFGSA